MVRKILFVLAIVVLLGGSAFAFAWWDSLEDNESVTIGVGQGVTLTVNLDETQETSGDLVPAGVVAQPGQVDEYVLVYDVELDRPIEGTLNLSVIAENILVNNASDLASYIDIDIDAAPTIGNEAIVVTVTVTLNVDSETNAADVEALKDADITFDLTFEATQ